MPDTNLSYREMCSPRTHLFRALEDGASLGAMLGKIRSKAELPAAIKLHESMRRDRSLKIREETFRHQAEFHLADGELQEARDKQLAESLKHQDGRKPW